MKMKYRLVVKILLNILIDVYLVNLLNNLE